MEISTGALLTRDRSGLCVHGLNNTNPVTYPLRKKWCLSFKNWDGLALHTVESQWLLCETVRAAPSIIILPYRALIRLSCDLCVYACLCCEWKWVSKYGHDFLRYCWFLLESPGESRLGKWVLEWWKEGMRLLPSVPGRPCPGLIPIPHALLRTTKLPSAVVVV